MILSKPEKATIVPVGATIDDMAASINTQLTEDQKKYVAKLSKTARGLSKVRSLYRDVPKPDEVKATGNFVSKIAPNAQELIDYALSTINPRMFTCFLSCYYISRHWIKEKSAFEANET